jgi:hypothetical protein
MSKFWSEVTMVMDLVTWLPGPVHVVTIKRVNIERMAQMFWMILPNIGLIMLYTEVRSAFDPPIGLSGEWGHCLVLIPAVMDRDHRAIC